MLWALLSLPFHLLWWLITFPICLAWDHPFLSAFLGWIGYELYQWKFGEPKIGQLGHAVRKSKVNEDISSNPEAVIVGAGPGGLAVGATLADLGVPYVILEKANHVADSWRNRYDRLHLHTTRNHSGLPFLPFPSCVPQFPSRDDVINYLDGYAKALNLNIKFNHKVTEATYDTKADRWIVKADSDGEEVILRPKFLIVASGEHNVPNVPQLEGQNLFRGSVVHTSSYKNASSYAGKKVLVVGFGNSGTEIAVDLWENGAKPSITCRSPVNIVSRSFIYLFEDILDMKLGARLLPVSMHDATSKLLIQYTTGDLSKWGITTPHPTKGVISNVKQHHVPPMLDIGLIDLIKQGEVKVVSKGVTGFTEGTVVFDDGQEEAYDDVILATGYKFTASYSFLNEKIRAQVVDENEIVVSGAESSQKGLFFIGFSDMFGRFREIHLEAFKIRAIIKGRLQL